MWQKVGRVVYSHVRYAGGKSWYVKPELSGDAFVALHIHFIYQFYDLFGWPVSIDAGLIQVPGESNWGSILMGFKNDLIGIIDFGMGLNFSSGKTSVPSYQWLILGENGCLEYDKAKNKNSIIYAGKNIFEEIPVNAPVQVNDTDNFIEQILFRKDPYIPLSEGRKAIELSLLASKSAKSGKRIFV